MNGLGTIVELLIAHGAKIDQVLYDDWTALHVACQLGKTNLVELLLKHKAAVNKTCKGDHMSPLHLLVKMIIRIW
jgi:ankyrin repeat protein